MLPQAWPFAAFAMFCQVCFLLENVRIYEEIHGQSHHQRKQREQQASRTSNAPGNNLLYAAAATGRSLATPEETAGFIASITGTAPVNASSSPPSGANSTAAAAKDKAPNAQREKQHWVRNPNPHKTNISPIWNRVGTSTTLTSPTCATMAFRARERKNVAWQ
jgi:hypothetical protein